MIRRRLLGVALVSVFAAGVVLADGPASDENYFDARWTEVEKAFLAAKESREFSRVMEELAKFFTSPSQDVKALGLRWIGYHRAELTTEELDAFSRLFADLNPKNSLSESVLVEMATRHLAAAPAKERSAVYMTAIRAGSVKLEGVEEMPRFVALGRAAADGLEEFRPLIEQYRDEIDAAYPADPYRWSEKLLWMLKLRGGAKNREDAVRLHAARLAEMEDESVEQLMDSNPAFRAATMSVLQSACEKRLSEPCLDMARVVLDQRERQERLASARMKTSEPIPEADWLKGMEVATAAARVKVSRERVEAPTRER